MDRPDLAVPGECSHFPPKDEEEQLFSWLISAGMSQVSVEQLLLELCERLSTLGVHLIRGNIAMTTLHPQVSAFMYTWREGEGIVSNTRFLHTDEPGEGWFASPFFYMLGQDIPFMHRRLDTGENLDFPVLVEFRDEGFTDWFSQVFDFGWGNGENQLEAGFGLITSWASAHPGGFTNRDFSILRRAIPLFALAVKGIASFEVAGTMLQTYVGQETAQEVLSGQIKRGTARSMTAVLIFADLRGFTKLVDTVAREDIVATLDQYLERMADPVTDMGGEVLKFMGDGMLATFELKGGEDADICRTALVSIQNMMHGIRQLNQSREKSGLPIVELDVALHIGEVMYGNVGSANRLDFTVVGSAVNEVCRMETLCDSLNTHVILSGDFVSSALHCQDHFEAAGLHSLRGVRTPRELYRLKVDSRYLTDFANDAQFA